MQSANDGIHSNSYKLSKSCKSTQRNFRPPAGKYMFNTCNMQGISCTECWPPRKRNTLQRLASTARTSPQRQQNEAPTAPDLGSCYPPGQGNTETWGVRSGGRVGTQTAHHRKKDEDSRFRAATRGNMLPPWPHGRHLGVGQN